MAALLIGTSVIRRYNEGTAELIGFYSIDNMSAGDTIQMNPDYVNVSCAALMVTVGPSAGNAAVAVVTANTVITIPAGPSASGGFLMAFGAKVAGA
jgi:hypothetical protein